MKESGYWQVQISDITINGVSAKLCPGCKVAVDTGTSMLAGPTDVINKLNKKLAVSPTCANYGSLPKLGFIFGGKILELTPKEYVNNIRGKSCASTLMTMNVPPPKGPLFILGIPFLQKYYSVYDNANARVGFAVAKHVGEQPASLLDVGDFSASAQAELDAASARTQGPYHR